MDNHCTQGDEFCPHLDVRVWHFELERLRTVGTIFGIRTGIFSQKAIGIFAVGVFDSIEQTL